MSRRATVLAYHAIGDCERDADKHNLFVSEAAFSRQMDFLAGKRQVVDLDRAVSGEVPGRAPAVAITFDDGYRNVLLKAGPILRRHGFPATVFVPTGYIGGRNTWIEDTPCDVDVMTEDELREAESLDLRMESHGHHHIDYGKASGEEARADLKRSLDVLESLVGRRPAHFAYPFGAHSQPAYEAVRAEGVRYAYTIDEPHGDDLAYERVQITPLDGMGLFALKTSGRYMRVRHSRAVKGAYGAMKPLARKVFRRT